MSAPADVHADTPVGTTAGARALAWSLRLRLWPRSMFARMSIIIFGGLAGAHLMNFMWLQYERTSVTRSMMLAYVGRDVASSLAILDNLDAAQRAAWLPRLERENYRYELRRVGPGNTALTERERLIRASVAEWLGAQRTDGARFAQVPGRPSCFEMELALRDGLPVTLIFTPPRPAVSPTTATNLMLQLVVLCAATWVAVRVATRPLCRLAEAADDFALDRPGQPLPEDGPDEVARAATAFNAMHRRIAAHLAERTQILAAVSHDLRTPLARMRLRSELLEQAPVRDKLQADLAEMQALVEDGLAYARSSQAPAEPLQPVDLAALVDSLAGDYRDAGAAVRSQAPSPLVWPTRAQTLRRLLCNLLDNALKFAGAAEIVVTVTPQGLLIEVLDDGPGIPQAQLQDVMQPFVRVEPSRSRETGGIGLGLAIARQLAQALGAELALANRPQGGLQARLVLPGPAAG